MKVALILFGISYAENINHWTGKKYKIDYEESINNYKKFIFEYFKNNNYEIDVFFSTYNSNKSEKLISDYKPKAYYFFNKLQYKKNNKRLGRNSNIKKAIKITLDYSEKNLINYDLCLITRYDLLFKKNFAESNIINDRLNIVSILEKTIHIDDNFYLMPFSMLKSFYNLINNLKIDYKYHKLRYPLENVFKINYILNEYTNISNLSFYKINRIEPNINTDKSENSNILKIKKTINVKNKIKIKKNNILKNTPKITKKIYNKLRTKK